MPLLLKVKPGTPQTLDPGDNPTFERWLARVDILLVRLRGISIHDLEDMPYREWYEARVRPVRAANKALKRAGADRY